MSTSLATLGGASSFNPAAIAQDDWIISRAIEILERRVFQHGPKLQAPSDVRDFLRMKLSAEPNEVFSVVFMDTQHRVLAYEVLFQGTIDSASVHPRVVLKRALDLRAAALVLCHNHPSGNTTPSEADRRLTQVMKDLLFQVDVRVLDHFIVGEGTPYSFAESGLL
ncbi:RadC family protein [Achromobacter pestifer]|uniref:MPN domain-containing protein n=1 Tax=Achromobacter pestifer TaxID=1353889 RepID=A0A6S6YV75_9BURK|nr:DNA repair protein RadC [Achromobacter pestifer]CAB3647751.1 hypothetical protein LMG3431_02596 [Achromobacter pestifer]